MSARAIPRNLGVLKRRLNVAAPARRLLPALTCMQTYPHPIAVLLDWLFEQTIT